MRFSRSTDWLWYFIQLIICIGLVASGWILHIAFYSPKPTLPVTERELVSTGVTNMTVMAGAKVFVNHTGEFIVRAEGKESVVVNPMPTVQEKGKKK